MSSEAHDDDCYVLLCRVGDNTFLLPKLQLLLLLRRRLLLLPVLSVTRLTIRIGGCLLSFFVAVIVVVLSFWVRVGEGKARARMTGRKERSKAKRQKHKRRHAKGSQEGQPERTTE